MMGVSPAGGGADTHFFLQFLAHMRQEELRGADIFARFVEWYAAKAIAAVY